MPNIKISVSVSYAWNLTALVVYPFVITSKFNGLSSVSVSYKEFNGVSSVLVCYHFKI
jgi:hypothetical protein